MKQAGNKRTGVFVIFSQMKKIKTLTWNVFVNSLIKAEAIRLFGFASPVWTSVASENSKKKQLSVLEIDIVKTFHFLK